MSLPPGFLDELRNRLSLSDVVGRKVLWDKRKSNAAKGDFWAPCPFHQEKTPSFHVDDRKGFYYCFGCQAKGDAITFVKEVENVSFIEAVEILARDAGIPMPERRHDPEAAERKDWLTRLAEVMEQAVRLYGLALRSAAGQGARDYVARRGLTEAALKRFEIGYAPDARHHQTEFFKDKGVLDEAVAAGLLIRPDDGGAPYDRFRGRLMFPIRDPRGRCIAFGGRALEAGAKAKYLNSPETELFHKGRTLYNHGPAREAAGKPANKPAGVIVAEGYMDVIALVSAGFDHAVAPLGTAVTEEQLALMWRMADEPVIALDGDQAGQRAAERLVDLALPKLEPGKSLRFCILPEGRDPDDLIRDEGPGAMQRALEAAKPLVEMLWRRETGAEVLDTPERRAAFDQRLKAALGRIAATVGDIVALVGFVDSEDGNLFNAAAVLNRQKVVATYRKIHLPNYGVFDERRYFTAGNKCPILSVRGIKVGVNRCEDIWEPVGPSEVQCAAGAQVIVNLNASPYEMGKQGHRAEIVTRLSHRNRVYTLYVNQVGGQDELVFDGGSMLAGPDGDLIGTAARFEEALLVADIDIGSLEELRLHHQAQAVPQGELERIEQPTAVELELRVPVTRP